MSEIGAVVTRWSADVFGSDAAFVAADLAMVPDAPLLEVARRSGGFRSRLANQRFWAFRDIGDGTPPFGSGDIRAKLSKGTQPIEVGKRSFVITKAAGWVSDSRLRSRNGNF
jgi:hypothetical protein